VRSHQQSALMENTLHELLFHRQPPSPTKMVVYLPYHFVGMDQAMHAIKMLRKQKLRIRLLIHEEVFRYYDKKEIVERTEIDDWITIQGLENMRDLDFLFLPILPFSLVSNILALNDQDRFVRFLLHSLFSNRKVSALSIGMDPNHSVWKEEQLTHGTPYLKSKLKRELQLLQSVGIHIIEPDEINCFFSKSDQKKKVMTAKDIQQFLYKKEKELVVDQQTIVTPLAKDMLKQHQINLISE
jgi:hypothetical protein